jgi:phage-related protein
MDLNTFLAKTLEIASQVLAQLGVVIKKIFTPQVLSNIWDLLKTVFTYAIKFLLMILDFITNLLKSLVSK